MKDDPIIRSLENTGLAPWQSELKQPHCPICGQECEKIYLNSDGDPAGCDECLTAYDAWEVANND